MIIFSLISIASSQCDIPQLIQIIPHPPFLDPFPAKVSVQPDFPDITTATFYLKDFRSLQNYSAGTVRIEEESVIMQGGRLSLLLNFTLKKSKLTNEQIQFSTSVSFNSTIQTEGFLQFKFNLTLDTKLIRFTNLSKLTDKQYKDLVGLITDQVNSNNQQLLTILQSYFSLFKTPLKKTYTYHFDGISTQLNMEVLQANLTASLSIIGYKGQVANRQCKPWSFQTAVYTSADVISANFIKSLMQQFIQQGYKNYAVFNRQDSKASNYDFGLYKTGYAVPKIYSLFSAGFYAQVGVNCKLQDFNLDLSNTQSSQTSHFCFVLQSQSATQITRFILNSTQRLEVGQDFSRLKVRLAQFTIKDIQLNLTKEQTELATLWISQVSGQSVGQRLLGEGLLMTPRQCTQSQWVEEAVIFSEC